MKKENTIISWTLPVALSLAIISFAVLFSLYFPGLYHWDINHLAIPQSTQMSEEGIKDNYNVLINYLTDESIEELHLPSFKMSSMGKIHFEDVKGIFIWIKKAFYILGIWSVLGILISIIKNNYRFLKHTAILIFVMPISILLLAMINFDKSFTIFHQLAFSNDYWIFDPAQDPVILILPQEFFMHSFILIISIVIVMAFLLYMIYFFTTKAKKRVTFSRR